MDSMNNFGASADPKSAVMNQVRQEAAMNNARLLIEVPISPSSPPAHFLYSSLHANGADTGAQKKINDHCFERCVPKPGSSLSSGETTCFTQCMEKYMAAWNTVSRQYIGRIQQEQGKAAGGGGSGMF
ncbi:Mitochondrial import inner membrane translocase subunit [Lachnellula occidentalis]|uniref:Mitochondrial import inner membrane translocase subunit n=1 Tax=Lachnellula occidentalis TaxID=215460 RepID=A0A8H8UK85_9HELO|nr:Mitochondrial import inner membrane translocase subunit [Lachnellula occidentalis]